ncbi:YciI family protein [Amycolatopsis sp. NPDC059021]|uniref:YciI family protein n=1 Tax=Amycolatopsis sp. NPDC059021 TaxID=3346704 RepID=UPI00366F770A
MAWYLVEIRYVQEKLAEVRPRHREFLQGLAEQGRVAVAGPLGDGTGGITLYQAEDETSLTELINQDPYHLEGVVAERTVREFKPVIGAWLPEES